MKVTVQFRAISLQLLRLIVGRRVLVALSDGFDEASLDVQITNRPGCPANPLQGLQSLLEALLQGSSAGMEILEGKQQSFDAADRCAQGMDCLVVWTHPAGHQG